LRGIGDGNGSAENLNLFQHLSQQPRFYFPLYISRSEMSDKYGCRS